MANSLCDGDLSTLTGEVIHLLSPSLDTWCPLTRVWFRLIAPLHYIVDSETVPKLISKINVNKAIGPNDIPSCELWVLHTLTLAQTI